LNKFDAVSVNIDTMHDYDKDLKRFLSYNPYHNLLTSKRLNLNFSEDYIKNFDREIIETDRSGWRGYDKIYSKHISHLKNKKINLLEIGIQYGYGLLAWARYFNKGLIEGLEYSTEYVDDYLIIKEKFKESKRINFNFPYFSDKKESWNTLYQTNYFDVIIDDGSHSAIVQLNTIKNGFSFLKNKL
jgi:hypothetical protein